MVEGLSHYSFIGAFNVPWGTFPPLYAHSLSRAAAARPLSRADDPKRQPVGPVLGTRSQCMKEEGRGRSEKLCKSNRLSLPRPNGFPLSSFSSSSSSSDSLSFFSSSLSLRHNLSGHTYPKQRTGLKRGTPPPSLQTAAVKGGRQRQQGRRRIRRRRQKK